jgi:hypothetical protein
MQRALPSTRRPVLLLSLALSVAGLAGCGKAAPSASPGGGPLRALAPVEAQGAVTITTRNTTRVGGSDAIVDAASVARVSYPGLTSGTRPQAVVIADQHDWAAALAAAPLAAAPLGAPLLYAEGESLPKVTLEALEAMRPTGSPVLGAQVIEIGTHAKLPARWTVRTVPGANGPTLAAEVARMLTQLQGKHPDRAIVLDTDGPRALQMAAPGLAAESGAPLLTTGAATLAPETESALRLLDRPTIYVMNGAALGRGVLAALAKLGHVTTIPQAASGETATAATTSIEAARYTDGAFGWGVKDPGHGLVFASAQRPFDAPGAALLSATGEYGPLLVLENPDGLPPELSSYLGDIQPAYTSAPEFQPVRGVYNHGWLIGDEKAISLSTQAQIDSLLEISPRKQGSAEEAAVLQGE